MRPSAFSICPPTSRAGKVMNAAETSETSVSKRRRSASAR